MIGRGRRRVAGGRGFGGLVVALLGVAFALLALALLAFAFALLGVAFALLALALLAFAFAFALLGVAFALLAFGGAFAGNVRAFGGAFGVGAFTACCGGGGAVLRGRGLFVLPLGEDGIGAIALAQRVRKAGLAAGEAVRIRADSAKGFRNGEEGAERDKAD